MQWHIKNKYKRQTNSKHIVFESESKKICTKTGVDQKRIFEIRNHRSGRPEVFCNKGALRNFAKFTGKNLCQSLFFNKVAG